MIKVYLDWNLMSQIKQGMYPEILSILTNKSKFLILYSSSHVSDIYSSYAEIEQQKKIIEDDLDFITSITDNWCFNGENKRISINRVAPKDFLNNQIESSSLFDDFSLDGIIKNITNLSKETEGLNLGDLISLIGDLSLDDDFKKAFENPESAQIMNKIFPSLKDDLTMRGFFKAFGEMHKSVNEGEGYKILREGVQKLGLNSGHFSPGKNPYDVIEKAYNKFGVKSSNVTDFFDNSKNVPEWFNNITNEYIKLDLHGFKADKIKVTEKKKQTFRNITEDSSHSAFASRCDIYITNDNNNYEKTIAVFNKLKVNVKVFKPDSFLNYANVFLSLNTFEDFLAKTLEIIDKAEGFYRLNYINNEEYINVHYTDYYLFNFFNKVMVSPKQSSGAFLLLSKEYPESEYFIMHQEIAGVIKFFVDQFGEDNNGMMFFHRNELDAEYWQGRTWIVGGINYVLTILSDKLQLYFYPHDTVSI